MGFILRYNCTGCGRTSRDFYVGAGMFDTLSSNVWSCINCAHTFVKTTEVQCRFFPDEVREESRTFNIKTLNETEYDLIVKPNSMEVVSIPHIQYILNHDKEDLYPELFYLKDALEKGIIDSIEAKGKIIRGQCQETGDIFAYETYYERIHLKCPKCGYMMINGVICPDCKVPMREENVGDWD